MMKRVVRPNEEPIFECFAPPRRVQVLVDKNLSGSENICAGFFILVPGEKSVPDVHTDMEEIYYIKQGRGVLILGGEQYDIEEGVVVYIPKGMEHQSINTGDEDLSLFWVFTPHVREYRHIKENWKRIEGTHSHGEGE